MTSFLLADSKLVIYELSNNFHEITGIRPQYLKDFKSNLDRDIRLYDILNIKSAIADQDSIAALDGQVVDVEFNFDTLLENIEDEAFSMKYSKQSPFAGFS